MSPRQHYPPFVAGDGVVAGCCSCARSVSISYSVAFNAAVVLSSRCLSN
jgi:hypothetical protein